MDVGFDKVVRLWSKGDMSPDWPWLILNEMSAAKVNIIIDYVP